MVPRLCPSLTASSSGIRKEFRFVEHLDHFDGNVAPDRSSFMLSAITLLGVQTKAFAPIFSSFCTAEQGPNQVSKFLQSLDPLNLYTIALFVSRDSNYDAPKRLL
eukprot:1554389-Pleurochrysis_carterae.AAC.1